MAPWLVSPTQLWLFFDNGMAYSALGLLTSERGKEDFCLGACGAHWQGFKLDVRGEGQRIGSAGDKLWGDTQWLEGRDASTGPQPVA